MVECDGGRGEGGGGSAARGEWVSKVVRSEQPLFFSRCSARLRVYRGLPTGYS